MADTKPGDVVPESVDPIDPVDPESAGLEGIMITQPAATIERTVSPTVSFLSTILDAGC